jgi:FAD/FMN-containing dehydrogenase
MEYATVSLVRRDLASLITGRVLELGDEGFANSLSIDNGRVTRRPFLVVLPSNTHDVAVTVKYCHERDIRLTTKAGGHSAAGYCLNSEGVVMDLADMNGVAFDPVNKQQLSVGAGTRWIQAYDFLRDRQSPYTVIGGGCAGVGVAGFTLGGGYSFISRSYGLGCDNVNGLEFVSTVGNVYELNNKVFKEPDSDKVELYRALRGAGGGNFGVVTRIDLQLQKTNVPRLTVGQVTFPFYRISEILSFYNDWVLKLPDEMAVYGMMRNFPNQRFGGKPTLALRFTPVFNGRFADAITLLEPLLDLDPDDVEFYSMTLPEWEDFAGASTQVRGHSAYIRSLVLGGGSLTDDVAEICKFYLGRAPSPDSYIVWTHTGGAIAKRGDEKSSFAHRDGMFTFELKSEWDSSQPLQARPNIEWAVDFFDELGQYAQGAYLNYIDPLLLEWQKKYYSNEYARLLRVQERWNQDGWLAFQQCIGSDYNITPPRTKPLDLSPLSRTIYKAQKD